MNQKIKLYHNLMLALVIININATFILNSELSHYSLLKDDDSNFFSKQKIVSRYC